MQTTRRSMLGFLGVGTAAIASRALTGCGSDTKARSDAGFDGGGFDGGYNTGDANYNVPDTDAGELCTPTRADVQGPFFVPGAPNRMRIASVDEPGEALMVFGMVVEEDCTTPIGGALLDVWQADAQGNYHDAGTDYRLRGQVLTEAGGGYSITTIKPGAYQTGPGQWRPAHIHFTVSKPGFVPVTTQLYFADDPFLPPNDSCTGCGSDDPDRVIRLFPGEGGVMGEFRIILRRQ